MKINLWDSSSRNVNLPSYFYGVFCGINIGLILVLLIPHWPFLSFIALLCLIGGEYARRNIPL